MNLIYSLILKFRTMKNLSVFLSLFMLISVSLSAQIPPDQDWAQFGRYEEANAGVAVRPLAVLIGDSITDGWDGKDPGFFSENNLVCRGISGQVSSQMLIRFRKDVLDLNPKYAVILAGTNDIACNAGYIAPENILGNIISMCELAKTHKIKPVLCSVTPSARFGWRKSITGVSEKIENLNAMIRKYAEENRIPYVDYHSALKDENGGLPARYSGDGVHPNLEGYKIMETILMESLNMHGRQAK